LLEAGSLPDVIMTRYDSPTAGMLAAIAMELGVMSYLATQIGYMVTALRWIALGLAMRALVVSGAYPELAKADHAAPSVGRES
jgi:hypothetical protein